MEEVLSYVKKSLEELEKITIYDLPKGLQYDIIRARALLSYVILSLEGDELLWKYHFMKTMIF